MKVRTASLRPVAGNSADA